MSSDKEKTNLALYRKYRPQSFREVLGQEHIIEPLAKAVKDGAFAHSYLFAGSRGTGKTSVARILARELGCTGEDLNEIDAASNRGIDDVRALREAVRTHPFSSSHKVYIIDEVHMLTPEAFNALLKTLEEPPEHVVFILATTELAKVPDTVVSRCQPFIFKKPPQKILAKAISDIAKKEGRTLDTSAANLIAFIGDGSFRDAQGVLQIVLSSCSDKHITREYVERVTSAPPREFIEAVIESLASGDTEKGLSAIARAAEQNVDFTLFSKLLLRTLRFILLVRFSPFVKKTLAEEITEGEFSFLGKFSGSEGAALNSAVLSELLDAHGAVGHAYLPHLPLELALIKLTAGKDGKQ